jgi:hypothetical protein
MSTSTSTNRADISLIESNNCSRTYIDANIQHIRRCAEVAFLSSVSWFVVQREMSQSITSKAQCNTPTLFTRGVKNRDFVHTTFSDPADTPFVITDRHVS